MNILEEKRINERLYHVHNIYCGVLVNEKVMKKLNKIIYKNQEEIKKVLTDNIETLYSYDWGLAYPNGKQTEVSFALKKDKDIGDRIKNMKIMAPEYKPEVYFVTETYSKETEAIIKAIEDMHNEEEEIIK